MELRDEVLHHFEDVRKTIDAELHKYTKTREKAHAVLIRKLKTGLRNNKLRDVIAGHNTLKIVIPEEEGCVSTIIEEPNGDLSNIRQTRRAAAKIATERTTETFKKLNATTKLRKISERTTNVKRQSQETVILDRPLKSQRLENKLYAGTRVEENDYYNEEPVKKFEKNNASPKVLLINMSDSFIKKNSRKRKNEEDKEELSPRTDKRLSEDLFEERADLGSEKSVEINLNSQNDTKYKSKSRRISGMESVSPLINVEDKEKKVVINKSSINSPENKHIVSSGKISQQSKEERNDFMTSEESFKDLPERSMYGKEAEANGRISYANPDEVTASTTNNLRNADDPGKVDNISEKLTTSCIVEVESLKPEHAPRTRTKVLKKDDPSGIDFGISETTKTNEKNSKKDSNGELEINEKLAGSCVEVESLKPERAVRTRTKVLKKEDRSEIVTGITETSNATNEKNITNGGFEISEKLAGSCVEVESLKPKRAVRTRTKVLKKMDCSEIDIGISETTETNEKNSEKDSNGGFEISEKVTESCVQVESSKPERALRTRTKVLKKADPSKINTGISETSKKNNEKTLENNSNGGFESEIDNTERTKVFGNENAAESKPEIISPEHSTRTRTKRLKKTTHPETQVETIHLSESRTKSLKKETTFELKSDAFTSGRSTRARTKGLKKDISQTPDHDERPTAVITPFDDSSDVPAVSPLLNNQQKTRTKVQEMAKKLEDAIIFHNTPKQDSSKTKNVLDGKENSKTKPIPSFVNSVSNDKAQRGTPLKSNNRIMTPFQSSKLISSTSKVKVIVKQATEEVEQKRKEEEQLRKLQKEAEAQRKREERILAAKEEIRRKREKKRQKVTAAREAAEKGKTELLAKLEKEREEKEAQVKAEKLKQKQELMMQKRQNLLMKAQEAEERRIKEETARLAKLKEQRLSAAETTRYMCQVEREKSLNEPSVQRLFKKIKSEDTILERKQSLQQPSVEEEQRRLAQVRLKQQLEAEKLFQQRQEEEQRTKAAQLYLKEKLKLKKKPLPQSYILTPSRDEREPLRPKNDEDYGIDDVDPNDSSDNENEPKKIIPAWALRDVREISLERQTYVAHNHLNSFFTAEHITPDLNAMFGEQTNIRVRTSSAVWTIPIPLINLD